jgi:hypothetical protein
MAEFDRGQTFLDLSATNQEGTKGKFFIGLSNADYADDSIVCFVFNTEKRMDKYHLGCNKEVQKYIVAPGTFSFVSAHSSIMLNQDYCYKLEEMYGDNIKLLDKADDNLSRQIKNCIDWDYILPKSALLIKQSFKDN